MRRLGGDVTDDPAASSFAKAMETSIGTVSIIDPNAEVFGRIWCVLGATRRQKTPPIHTHTHTATTYIHVC